MSKRRSRKRASLTRENFASGSTHRLVTLAHEIDCHIRGLSPFPGAWFEAHGERVKALMSRPAKGVGAPGEILEADDRLVVACGGGAVELVTLQRAGKKPQGAAEFLRGFAIERGAMLA
ncbi:MAG: hypothetical protein R3C58_12490 [Parvularculaceae bacterium]